MSVGMSLLVHQELARAAELVQALHKAGGKIGIHVDAKVADTDYATFYRSVGGLKNVVFAPRRHCEWGRWSLVEAQIATVETLLDRFDDLSHVIQLSGSCLPNRPLPELFAFLARNHSTDFIESVMVGGANWIKGGLEAERLSLYFPFSFTRHRRRFDAFVWLQRKLRINRKMPKGLTPHIGSQWWALTSATLKAILNDPDRARHARFFSKCWIPDESYFQTLVRKHSQRVKSRSLTYSRFDYRGKPMMFYDDHARFVAHLDSFFVRKVWHGAGQLYLFLLDPARRAAPRNKDMAVAFAASVERAESRWLKGREGLFMQGRAPRLTDLSTATSYTVLTGFDRVFAGLSPWLHQQTGIVLHEGLWSKNKSEFERAKRHLKGNMASSRKVRDNNAEGFLLNFVWNHSDDDPIFCFDPPLSPSLAKFISFDANARVFHISEAWLLDLLRNDDRNIASLRQKVQALTLKEQAYLAQLKAGRAKVQEISLAEVMRQPGAVLEELLYSLRPRLAGEYREIPDFLPKEGLDEFIEFLRDAGLNLSDGIKSQLDPVSDYK